jgi:parallel beta-helix repeat protein
MSTLTEAVTAYEAQLNTVVGTFVAANAAAEGNAALTAADRLQTGEDRIAASDSAADALASKEAASDKAAEALASQNAIDERNYPGSYSADPATRPSGAVRQGGDEYFNGVLLLKKRFNGTAWQVPDINTTNLAAAGGAGLVTFTQAGAGAKNRTAEERLKDVVSITDYLGADPLGILDSTAALGYALTQAKAVRIPEGVFVVNSVSAADKRIFGPGTLRKKPGTNGVMLNLSGNNRLEDAMFDYDWQNAAQTQPYSNNKTVLQTGGRLSVLRAAFDRSFTQAIAVMGGSLSVTAGTTFERSAPHNNLTAGNERPTEYVTCYASAAMTGDETIRINGNTFTGTSTALANLHLNPCAVFLTNDAGSGKRYKSVNITGNDITACGGNAGNGNVTGAIDTYNGVENLVISGNTIRLFSYAGIKVQNSSRFAITGNTITEGATPAGAAVVGQAQGIITQQKVRGSVVDQEDSVIMGNVITQCTYLGISNSCENVNIVGNTVNDVALATLGTGIGNTGNKVNIALNVLRRIKGSLITSTGNDVSITDNKAFADGVGGGSALSYSGSNVKISGNTLSSTAGSGQSGIRTDGPASNVRIDGNTVRGYSYGTDIRTTGGAVDVVDIGLNTYESIGTGNENIAAGATNVSRQRRSLPVVTVTYDPPSLAVGVWDAEQTLTFTGAAVGDTVIATGVRDMFGIQIAARVSAANTVTYAFFNPSGNPNGTRDLLSTVVRFQVTKTA